MFRHILVATDGSSLSERAALNSIELARALGARITAVHVSPPFHLLAYGAQMAQYTREGYEAEIERQASRFLAFVARAAAEKGVACDTVRCTGDDVHRAILDLAKERGCDVIAMASHGRRGVAAILLGSETQKVLTHGDVPVLVWRP